MIQPLPIKDYTEPLRINGKNYFVIGSGTDEEGDTFDTLQSEETNKIKTFKRKKILQSINK